MYAAEIKTRQPQVIIKSSINSKKTANYIQPPKCMDPKVPEQITMPTQITNGNLSKSKFTVLGSSKVSTQPCTKVTLVGKVTSVTKRENRKPGQARKSNIPITSGNKTTTAARIAQSSQAASNRRVGNRKNLVPPEEALKNEMVVDKPREIAEMAIQTNESEILNHSLIVGDLKIVMPSKSITDEIDKLRKEVETKKLLMATRNFEEHSQQDEQHLDALKEFLDKSYITRRPLKLRDKIFEEDRKLIASMDELLQRERPKTESITDIRSRIKNKEQELLSLFEHFQKKTEHFAKTNS